MKTKNRINRIIIIGAMFASQSAQAQFIVDTPLARFENTLHHVAQIAKIVETIRELRETKDRLGDASSVTEIAGAAQAIADLGQSSSAQSRIELASAGTTGFAGENGRPQSIAATFVSRDGQTVSREDVFKPEAAIFQAVANYDAVREEVVRRSVALRIALRDSTVQAQAAGTHAEVLKANGVIAAGHAAREAAAWELEVASQQAIMLDIQNRAAKEAEEKAKRQEQSHELTEGLRHYTEALRPPSFISSR